MDAVRWRTAQLQHTADGARSERTLRAAQVAPALLTVRGWLGRRLIDLGTAIAAHPAPRGAGSVVPAMDGGGDHGCPQPA
jgi:hypothetical protein